MHVDDVALLHLVGRGAIGDALDVGFGPDHAFAQEKTGRQLEIVAGRAHGDRDAVTILTGHHADFHRFLDGQQVIAHSALSAVDDDDARGRHADGRFGHHTFSSATAVTLYSGVLV
jgi:hypothetical protein